MSTACSSLGAINHLVQQSMLCIVIHWAHYLFSDWPITCGKFSKSAPTLHTASAREIWIDQSGFSRREKLYCPDIELTSQERHTLGARGFSRAVSGVGHVSIVTRACLRPNNARKTSGTQDRKGIEIRQRFSPEMILNMHEKGLQFKKSYQFAKSEKYGLFCVSKLLFWRQKQVAGFRHGN